MALARRLRRVPHLLRIELESVSVRYGTHWALDRVTFDVRAGERWLLQGPNGAGKTVLLKLLRGDLWPTPRDAAQRRYHMSDGEVQGQPLEASAHIAYLGPERQDRYERYESTLDVAQVVHSGFDDSDFPLAPPRATQRRRIAEVLAGVGLAGLAARKFRSLSYGQRRRILLARALVRKPDVLLLDEALNGLDVTSRRAFLQALQRTVSRRTSWVFSTHRRSDSPPGTTHVARMEHGRLVVQGPVAVSDGVTDSASLSSDRGDAATARTALRRGQTRSALLRVERASVFRDERRVIGAFDWSLLPGQHWHVSGANGSGKSTLIAMLYGDLWPAWGGVLRRGGDGVMPIEQWKRGVGLVSPELQAAYATTACSVEEIVVSGFHSSIGLDQRPTARERERAMRELQRWRLAGLAARRARELSYGQLRRVLIARAFVAPRRLYLLDEPFDGLDTAARQELSACLEAVRHKGATIVLATHHLADVPEWITNRVSMRAGKAPLVRGAAPPRRR